MLVRLIYRIAVQNRSKNVNSVKLNTMEVQNRLRVTLRGFSCRRSVPLHSQLTPIRVALCSLGLDEKEESVTSRPLKEVALKQCAPATFYSR